MLGIRILLGYLGFKLNLALKEQWDKMSVDKPNAVFDCSVVKVLSGHVRLRIGQP